MSSLLVIPTIYHLCNVFHSFFCSYFSALTPSSLHSQVCADGRYVEQIMSVLPLLSSFDGRNLSLLRAEARTRCRTDRRKSSASARSASPSSRNSRSGSHRKAYNRTHSSSSPEGSPHRQRSSDFDRRLTKHMQKQPKDGYGDSPMEETPTEGSAHTPSRSRLRNPYLPSSSDQRNGSSPSSPSSHRTRRRSIDRNRSPSPYIRDKLTESQDTRNYQNTNTNHFRPETSGSLYNSPKLNRKSESKLTSSQNKTRREEEMVESKVLSESDRNRSRRGGAAIEEKNHEVDRGRGRGKGEERLEDSATLPLPPSVGMDKCLTFESSQGLFSQTHPRYFASGSSKPVVRPRSANNSEKGKDTDIDGENGRYSDKCENMKYLDNYIERLDNHVDKSDDDVNGTKSHQGRPSNKPQGSPPRVQIDNINSAFLSIQDKDQEERSDSYRGGNTNNGSYTDDDDSSWVAEAKNFINLLQGSEKTDTVNRMKKVSDSRHTRIDDRNDGVLIPVEIISDSAASSGTRSDPASLSEADRDASYPPRLPLSYSHSPDRNGSWSDRERYKYSDNYPQSEIDDLEMVNRRRMRDIDSDITGGYTEIAASAKRRTGASPSLLKPTESQILRQQAMGITPDCHNYFSQKHRTYRRDYDSDGSLSLTSGGKSWRGGSFDADVTAETYQEMQMDERYGKWNQRYRVPVDVYGFSLPFSRSPKPSPSPTAYPPLYDESIFRMRRGFEQSPNRGTFNRAPKHVADTIDAHRGASGGARRRSTGQQYNGLEDEWGLRECLSREREFEDDLLIEIESAMALEVNGMELDNKGLDSYRTLWSREGRRPSYSPHHIRFMEFKLIFYLYMNTSAASKIELTVHVTLWKKLIISSIIFIFRCLNVSRPH